MNNTVAALGMFVAGTMLGFTVGYYMNRKKQEKDIQEAMEAFDRYSVKEDSENSQREEIVESPDFKPAKFAKPDGTPGINYTKYNKDQVAKAEAESPTEEDISEEEDMSEYEETYDERMDREKEEELAHSESYHKENKGKIELMQSDDWDTDFPENDYDREDLYYFTEDDTLTDEDGKVLPEEEFIGAKPRQVGWMRSPDDVIYIRNHPKEKEYRVFKENCSVSDWF